VVGLAQQSQAEGAVIMQRVKHGYCPHFCEVMDLSDCYFCFFKLQSQGLSNEVIQMENVKKKTVEKTTENPVDKPVERPIEKIVEKTTEEK